MSDLVVLACVTVAVVVGFVLVLRGLIREQAAERGAWARERQALVDRVIAGGNVGQVIALDRTREPRERRDAVDPPPGRMAGMY